MRLRELRKAKEITMKQLGSFIGVAESTISQYETGKREPDFNTCAKLADYFNVSVDYLLGRSAFPAAPAPTAPGSKWVPVLGKVAAGMPIEAITDVDGWEEIGADMALRGEYFALRIHGDSMQPDLKDGDIVIVRQQSDCETGDIAVVLVNGEDAVVKQIKKIPEGILLVSFNSEYDAKFFSNNEIARLPVTIIGKVVESRRKF